MAICLITGDHPRHKYLVKILFKSKKISGWVIEKREEIMPIIPENIENNLKQLFFHHFKKRNEVENSIFNLNNEIIDLPTFIIDKNRLNSKSTIEFIKNINPYLVISFGCHKLNSNFMEEINSRFWNIHGGITPDYRGVTTHFWPSYFLEPQMTGITLHETTNFLDAGEILLQTAAPMVRGDSLHRLACRNVEHFSETLLQKLYKLDLCQLPRGVVKKGYGKVFKGSDWRPEHLKIIYEIYKDKIVDAVLDGKLIGRQPKLCSVL